MSYDYSENILVQEAAGQLLQNELGWEGVAQSRRFDISRIDFDLLRREFATAKRKNLVIKDLDELVQERIDGMLRVNPERINYYQRYQEIIADYNSEQDRATIEKTFMDLMDLANHMDAEQKRYVREGFSSDEELALYDMLFSENLSRQDIQTIKKVAVDLLAKIKARIAELDHWTDKDVTQDAVKNLIRDVLWRELPDSAFDQIEVYRQRIYEYEYSRYKEIA